MVLIVSRRSFLSSLIAAGVAAVADPDRLLWVPGARTYFDLAQSDYVFEGLLQQFVVTDTWGSSMLFHPRVGPELGHIRDLSNYTDRMSLHGISVHGTRIFMGNSDALRKGDVFTIAGVYVTNPQTGLPVGHYRSRRRRSTT